jgi:murein L,D-transpeptidase YafK
VALNLLYSNKIFARLTKNLFLKTIFVFAALLLSSTTHSNIVVAALTNPIAPEEKEKNLVPDALLHPNVEKNKYLLLVEKSDQKAYLYDSSNIDHPLKVYPCSTGENKGPKSKKNDKKTPEGVYFVTNSFKERELSSIYGVGAFPIDYPNPRDRKLRKEGYGIWIHGTNQGLKPRDTNGCIVFKNQDIIELSNYISKKYTPVIVTKKINFVKKKELAKESSRLKKFITDWLETWKQGKIDLYMSHYSKEFTAQGKNWDQWQAHKKRLSKKYGAIDIKIDNLEILRENGIVLAKFDQAYTTNRFFSVGEKRLYLEKTGQGWKITDEFFKREKEFTRESVPKINKDKKDLADIKTLISNWRKAWQSKDLVKYMNSYSEDFFSQGFNRAEWKIHKSNTIKKYSRIKVNISNLKIELTAPDEAKAYFVQEYYADEYNDKGKKTIKLIKKNGKWKIREETWVPLIKKKTR